MVLFIRWILKYSIRVVLSHCQDPLGWVYRKIEANIIRNSE